MKRLAFTLLGLALAFGLIAFYQLYRDSAPTPDGAVRQYVARITQNTPQEFNAINVVSSTNVQGRDNERLLLFRAADASTPVHMAGYAIVRKTLFGWHTGKLQMAGKSPLPQDILANLDWSDGRPVLFGEVFLRDAASIEAVFDDPNSGHVVVKAEIPVGNFMLLGPRYGELLDVQLLDASGNTLRRVTPQELTGD